MTVRAKDLIVKPVKAKPANELIKRLHYSGKVVQNSNLHLGVFLGSRLEGVMSFGSPMDKRKSIKLVEGTSWSGMLELNRMAFSESLPKNSESRALSIAFKLIKKHYPHIEWVLSFSDGTQCGDGAIYRASGFILTQIKVNNSLYETPSGIPIARMTWDSATPERKSALAKQYKIKVFDSSWLLHRTAKANNMKPLKGFQLRYLYFINKEAKSRLTVPAIPFSRIDEIGAGMYKGKSKRVTETNFDDQSKSGGATPTHTLQSIGV